MRKHLVLAVAILLGALSAASLFAQDTASLTGTVTDPSGAAVANAQVSVDNAERGVHRALTTNEAGEYSAPALPAPAAYDITVVAQGFKKYAATGVTLRVAEKTRVNVALQVGASTTEVTVVGSNVAKVETESSDLGGTVTGKEISQLQLNGRNFTQLVTLVPGVSNQTGQDEGQVGITGSVAYSMNGGRIEYNNWELDGGDNMDNGSNGSLNVYPSIDAIAEFKVLTSNYGAQYGRNGSGTVEVETKSGTSSFHGDAYEFVRNDKFNAQNFFNGPNFGGTGIVPAYKKNDFGYTIGGPIYVPNMYNTGKQKTFFFWSQEWRRERVPATFNQAVPYSQERTGNFSDICPDPTSSTTFQRTDPAGANYFPDCPGALVGSVWNIFPNNQVTVDAVAPVLLGLIPVGTEDIPGASSYNVSITQPTTWREELLRVDHNVTEHHRLTFRYVHDSWETVQPSTIWTGSNFPTVRTDFKGPGVSMVARLTSTVSPSLLNEFVASYTTDHISFKNTGTAWQRPADLPIGYLFNNGFGGKLPSLSLAGNSIYNFYVDPAGLWPEGPYNSNPTYTYRDNVTKIIGRHNLQFGAYFAAAQKNELSSVNVAGELDFNAGSAIGTGNSFADLLIGRIGGYSQGSNQVKFYNRYKIFEPYFQDDFRITSRLTLNLGLRVSMLGTYREKYKHAYNWDPALYDAGAAPQVYFNVNDVNDPLNGSLVPDSGNPFNGLVQCGVGSVPVGCSKGKLFNPAPRIGFAYDPWGDGKTAIRGGYGIFFEHSNGNEANTEGMEGQSSPLLQSESQSNIVGYTNIGGGGGLSPSFPFTFISIPKQVIWPYMQQWHLDVQREFLHGTVMTVSYVGSKGTHLGKQLDLNQIQPTPAGSNPYKPGEAISTDQQTLASGASVSIDCGTSFDENGIPLNATTPSGAPITGQAAVNLALAACYTNSNLLRPFHGIGTITRLLPAASSNYNALQIAARRSVGGLTINASYTYAHSIDDSSDRYDAAFVNSYNPSASRASSSFDVRHALSVGYVYDLPFFKHGGLSHTILGGWQWSGITSITTGTPFSVTNATTYGDSAGVGNGVGTGSYADRIGDPKANIPPAPAPGTSSFWIYFYNPNAYAAPRGLTFGNSGRNSLRNPRRTNFDMALFKRFAVTESKLFEFRAEAFNIFNHPQWAGIAGDAGASGFTTGNNGLGADNFLQIGNAHNPRILQLGAKFIF